MIGAVIVHYGDRQTTWKCVESLFMQCDRILVVDNQDNFDSNLDYVFVQKPGFNSGYGAACNWGADKLMKEGCDKILFLNNDVVINRPDFFAYLENLFETTGADIVSPCIKEPGGRFHYTGAWIDISGGTFGHRRATTEVMDTEIVAGNCFAITAAAFKKIWFREALFMYCEDLDLSIRAKAAGLKSVCAQFLWAIHADHCRAASPIARYYHTRNIAEVMRAYRGPLWMLYYWLWFIPVRIAYFTALGRLRTAGAVLAGAFAYLRRERGRNAAIA